MSFHFFFFSRNETEKLLVYILDSKKQILISEKLEMLKGLKTNLSAFYLSLQVYVMETSWGVERIRRL